MLCRFDDGFDGVDAEDHFCGKSTREAFNHIGDGILQLLILLGVALFDHLGEIALGYDRNAHAKTGLVDAAVHQVLRRSDNLNYMDFRFGIFASHVNGLFECIVCVLGVVVRHEDVFEPHVNRPLRLCYCF